MSRTPPPALQRAASLVHLPPLLAELGVPLDAVLDGTGVAPGDLRPDAFIPYAAYLAILDHAARLTGHEDIGLRLGRRQTLAALGPLGRVMRHAATLGEAMSDFAALQIHNSAGGAVYLLRAGDDVLFGYGVLDPAGEASPHIHDMVLAVGCNLVAELTGGRVSPVELHSTHPAPAALAPYHALCDCPIRFDQGQTALVLRADDLDTPLPGSDRARHDAALEDLRRLSPLPRTTASLVRHTLRRLLISGRTTMPAVAAHLGLHPRSLRRRLEREDTTFEALRDEVRYAVARELLRLNALPVGDIAATLAFATPSAFVRAFKRWSGTSPARWRDAHARPGGRAGRREARVRRAHRRGAGSSGAAR